MIYSAMPTFLLLMCVVASIGLLFVFCLVVYARPSVAVILVLFSIATQAFSTQPPSVSVGATIYLTDVVFIVMMLVGSYRVLLQPRVGSAKVVHILILMIFATNLIRGVAEGEAQAAVNESRTFLYFVAGSLFMIASPMRDGIAGQIVRNWIRFALILTVIAVCFWLFLVLSIPIQAVWSTENVAWGNSPIRVLSSQQTMFLSSALFMSLGRSLADAGEQWERSAFLWILPAILLLSHRTVWIVLLLGFTLIFMMSNKMRAKYGIRLPLVGLFGGVALIVANFIAVEGNRGGNSISDLGTLVWRIESNDEIWHQFGSRALSDKLFGQPFGAGFEREVAGAIVELQPHNFYVQTLISLGAVGLVVLFLIYLVALAHGTRVRKAGQQELGLDPNTWLVLLTGQLIYYLTYGVTVEMGILLGLCLAVGDTVVDAHSGRAKEIPSTPARSAGRTNHGIRTGTQQPSISTATSI